MNELRKRKRSFIIQAIAAINHSQTLLNDLKVNGDSDEDDIFDDKVDGRTLPRPGRSNLHGRKDYESSCWGRMLTLDKQKLQDPNSEESRIFRLRFRIPYAMFELLLSWVTDWLQNEEHLKSSDCTGRQAVPTSLKSLGVLRILGRGTCLDGIKELSEMSESTMWSFFHKFCAWFTEVVYPKFVSLPKTRHELEKIMGPYIALGLNGACGSTDAVHFASGTLIFIGMMM